jgi:hypothetical protein
MIIATDIQPGQQVQTNFQFPPLVDGENQCVINYQAVCGDEVITRSMDVCIVVGDEEAQP